MKTAIMQPYFMPYIGYFQLIAAVDLFIIYDNIKYTKKGWINRNRILRNGQDVAISLPLKSDSDKCEIIQRRLADDFAPRQLLAQIEGCYRTAPFYAQIFPLLEEIFRFDDTNLFRFLHNSIEKVCAHLLISTPIRISSTLGIDHTLKAQEKVLAICAAASADVYINPIGGLQLYSKEQFANHGVELRYLRASLIEYPQSGAPFVPWLSIIDLMMFNPLERLNLFLRSGWSCE